MCIPEQLFEKQTKQVISDERWVVSKIIKGIETIFNTKKIINNAFRIVGSDRELIQCFTGKKQTLIKEISQNNITKYDPTIFLMDALKNFNKDYQGPIFTMENINNLYIKLFEFLELDLEGLRLLLNVNQRDIPDCNELSEETNKMIEDKLIPPKTQFIEEIKTIFYKMWALQENSDNLDEFRRKNANKEIPENIRKAVLQRFFQIYTSKCQISTLVNIFKSWIAGRARRRGDEKGIFKKYLGIINNAFPDLDEKNKLDKLIMDSNFLMNKVLQDKLTPIPYYATEVPECEYSIYINILFPEYIYNKKYQDKIEDQRISYVVYRNNSCSVPIKGYFKPTREFGGSIEPNQVFENKEQCQEYKKQKVLAAAITAEATERSIAEYGDLTDPDVSGNVADFVIPGGTWGVDEIPGKCYRAEDSGKDLSEKWYEKGNILFLMHFSEIDPNQQDLTVCVSKEYLEERMTDNTNIYYPCTGPRADILNGPRRGQIIPIEEVRPDERYDRLPSSGSDAADVSNQDETFIKINMAEEQLRNELGEKTVDTTVPAYLRINDVRKIIQIVTENPDKTRIFSLIPDGERPHTVTKSVMLREGVVGGFHCQNNSVINIFKVRGFTPQTDAPGLWNDIITEPPPAIYSPNTPSYNPDILAPFTRQPEGSEIREGQRPSENTAVIEDNGELILQGQVERQDYDPDLDDLYDQLDALVEDEVVAINMGPADELGQRTQDLISDARSYLGQRWREQLDEIRTPYSNEDIVFLSRLRRWLSESRRDRELRFWNPQDFRPDPPLVDNIEFTNWNEIAETFAGGARSDSGGSILELGSEESDSEPDESNIARQLFADDQSVDENNNQITQEEFENLITDTRMAIVNANLRMMRAGRPYRFIFSQDETDNAYNLLGNATIENVDRIYELRRLIDERLQNLPNP